MMRSQRRGTRVRREGAAAATRWVLPAIVLLAFLAPACKGGPPAPSAAPSISPSPTETEPTLSAKDRKYLRRLGKSGRSEFASDEEAIAAGQELCETIERADKEKGSVDVELAPSFTELQVDGLTVSFDVYIAGIKVYCPKFGHLVQEFPAP